MQLNGLQTPSSPSSQTSFSPSSDAHPERKNQPLALISVAARFKYEQDSFRTTLRQHSLSELRVNADAVTRNNAHRLISYFFSLRCHGIAKLLRGLREPRRDVCRSKRGRSSRFRLLQIPYAPVLMPLPQMTFKTLKT